MKTTSAIITIFLGAVAMAGCGTAPPGQRADTAANPAAAIEGSQATQPIGPGTMPTPGNAMPTDQSRHPLKDFRLQSDLSAAELLREVGPPARYAGSGVTWFVYSLDTGDELWLLFEPQTPGGFSVLRSADIHKTSDGGVERARIFGESPTSQGP